MAYMTGVLDNVPTVTSCGYNTCAMCKIIDMDFVNLCETEQQLLSFLFKHGVLSCIMLCVVNVVLVQCLNGATIDSCIAVLKKISYRK